MPEYLTEYELCKIRDAMAKSSASESIDAVEKTLQEFGGKRIILDEEGLACSQCGKDIHNCKC